MEMPFSKIFTAEGYF